MRTEIGYFIQKEKKSNFEKDLFYVKESFFGLKPTLTETYSEAKFFTDLRKARKELEILSSEQREKYHIIEVRRSYETTGIRNVYL